MVISDLHMDPNYTESAMMGGCTELGKYGRDSPNNLLMATLKEAKKQVAD